MRKILLAALSFIMLFELAASVSEDPLQITSEGIKFNYEDSVSGQGNFVNNDKIIAKGPHSDARVLSRLATVSLLKKGHGSGSIERETIIKSTGSNKRQTSPDVIYAYALIAALGNSSMIYAPYAISIGKGYYANHPVHFNSLLEDTSQIKNYASKTSMGNEINYAHAINMDLVASVEDDYFDAGAAQSLTRSLMNLNEGVTSGTAHLTMLQGGSRRSKNVWSKPDIDVDQVYMGTFDIATEMNLTLPVYKNIPDNYWLPCCFDGYLTMPTYYQRGTYGFGSNVKGVFDCTCPKVSTKAQYLREG